MGCAMSQGGDGHSHGHGEETGNGIKRPPLYHTSSLELPLTDLGTGSAKRHGLPRGGLIVETESAGPIQFGMPPETVKDVMSLKLQAPEHYVVPLERFDRQYGINVAEFEFPAYFNFFIKRQQINLVTTARGEDVIRKVLQETLFGPEDLRVAEDDCHPTLPKEQIPDIRSELDMFRKNPFKPGERMEIDDLVRFTLFDENGIANINDEVSVRVCFDEPIFMDHVSPTTTEHTTGKNRGVQSRDTYVVMEGQQEIARIPMKVDLRLPAPVDPDTCNGLVFSPPLFGVTMLGSSHGFDPNGSTTGMVVWVNHAGIMVDPPPNSGSLLAKSGIPASSVTAIILTHCHADHDAGAFQKILAEKKVRLITTPTIMKSLIRKYSAVTGLEEDLLKKLFVFQPALLGQRVLHNGAELKFSYALHSIPCIRFEIFFGGKSMVFSGDTFNHPERLKELYDGGQMSKERYHELVDFPWDHDLILHEAGVPPIHTPMSTFEPLSDEIKERLYLVHVAKKDVPLNSGLKAAQDGVDATIKLDAVDSAKTQTVRLLSAIGGVDIFSRLPVAAVSILLQTANTRKFETGDVIVQQGDDGDAMFVISLGVCGVYAGEDRVKTLVTGDYFGEIAAVTQSKRTVTIKAASPCVLFEWDVESLQLALTPEVMEHLERIAELREAASWDTVAKNTFLSQLSQTQKMEFQGLFHELCEEPTGKKIWLEGDSAEFCILLASGRVVLDEQKARTQHERGKTWTLGRTSGTEQLDEYGAGAWLGDFAALRADPPGQLKYTLRTVSPVTFYRITRDHLNHWLERNPGVSLILLDAIECT